jgi:ABC-2 type transport system permease protein
MRRVRLTAKYEMRSHLSRRSFWLTTFVLPAALVLVMFLIHAFSGGSAAQTALPGVASDTRPIGYVDEGNLLRALPALLPADMVREYQDEQEAQSALGRAEIDRYYLVPADYVASGRLVVVQERYQPLRAVSNAGLITYLLDTGLTGNEGLARLLLDPTPTLQTSALAPVDVRTLDNTAAAGMLPYLLMFILYLALAMTSGFMLQTVSSEKENRTAEMLLVSMRPRDLMLGKIAGLSVVGLLQVAVWLACFFGIGNGFGSVIGVDLHVTGLAAARIVPWTIGYFLLGYLMYAAVYATLGVLTPTVRDANHFVYIAIIPLVIPLLFNTAISGSPNGPLAISLSLFPLTSPIAMVARLGSTLVPWWQSLAGLAALGVFAYVFILAAARLFRAENVLSSRALTWGRLRGGLSRQTAGPVVVEVDAAKASGAPRVRPPKQPLASSTKRLYMSLVVALAVVVFGLVEYLVRGDKSGAIIAAVGVVAGVATYARRRRS